MKQINDHTALPWEIRDNTKLPYGHNYYIHNSNANAVVSAMDGKDNTEFILTACNNFYEMKNMISELCKLLACHGEPDKHTTVQSRLEASSKLLKELDK